MHTLTLPGLGPPPPEPVARAGDAEGALHELFGFASFRPGQREAVEAVIGPHPPRDVLVVMPTGSGKSLCYQLPALMRADLTVVVSPLVSLMQDQVEAVERVAPGFVGLINAQQDAARNRKVLARAAAGQLRLLYVAPERFSSPGFLERIREARIGLFVVDEAHCVSQWGHDFRPDYFRLADAARYVGARAIVASTATATPRVAADIVRRLKLRDPVHVATGFDRPNLAFGVARPAPHEKLSQMVEALRREDSLPAIVYAGTRAGSEELAEHLGRELGVSTAAYHAGLERYARADVQRRFLTDDLSVIVATNAFGMGVDKPNVRTVIHASVPASLEAYYQEAGRGGRDGLPARALLFAENRDKALHVHFIRRDELDEKMPGRLAWRLAADANADGAFPELSPARYDIDAGQLAGEVDVSSEQLRALVGHLARAGVLEPSPSAPDRVAGRIVAGFDGKAAALCRTSVGEASKARWRQYREIWAYVESESCRRRTILRHFGDHSEPAPNELCCDACGADLVPAPPPVDLSAIEGLDDAIVSVARMAKPAVGRTTCAEILHGARTKKIERNSYDGLPAYGTSSNMRRADILTRIDELIEEKQLGTTSGPYPVLVPPSSVPA
jgi:ATP-dependent DNA helicase RecQ